MTLAEDITLGFMDYPPEDKKFSEFVCKILSVCAFSKEIIHGFSPFLQSPAKHSFSSFCLPFMSLSSLCRFLPQ